MRENFPLTEHTKTQIMRKKKNIFADKLKTAKIKIHKNFS